MPSEGHEMMFDHDPVQSVKANCLGFSILRYVHHIPSILCLFDSPIPTKQNLS